MSKNLIDCVVRLAEMGMDYNDVLETSLSYAPGRRLRVKAGTTAMKQDGGSVGIPEGTIVTVVGVGGGATGVDPQVQLPDGTIATVPFNQVMESKLPEMFDMDDADVALDEPTVDVPTLSAQSVTDVVMEVTLAKPIPDGAKDMLRNFNAYGLYMSPPTADSASSLSFLVRGSDDAQVNAALEILTSNAGASWKGSKPATLMDWQKSFKVD